MHKSRIAVILFLCTMAGSTVPLFPQEIPGESLLHFNEKKLPYILKQDWLSGSRYQSQYAIDLDGDQEDEWVIFETGRPFELENIRIIKSQIPGTIGQKSSSFPVHFFATFLDIDKDGRKEVLYTIQQEDTSFLYVLNMDDEIVLKILAGVNPGRTKRKWICPVIPQILKDVNGDGFPELIYIVSTSYAYQPRSVVAYDLIRNDIIWEERSGYLPQDLKYWESPDQKHKLFVHGTSSPDNGRDAFGSDYLINGTHDGHGYLVSIRLDGRLQARVPVTEKFSLTDVYVQDMRHNGQMICYYKVFNKNFSNFGIWNPVDGTFGAKISREGYRPEIVRFYDFNRDGAEEILIVWSDGRIAVYDDTLEELYYQTIQDFSIRQCLITDINLDGEMELIISGRIHDTAHLLVLDRFLAIKALHRLTASALNYNNVQVYNPGYGKPKSIMAMIGENNYLFSYRRHIPELYALDWTTFFYGFLASGLLIGLGAVFFFRRTLRRNLQKSLRCGLNASGMEWMMCDAGLRVIIHSSGLARWLELGNGRIKGSSIDQIFNAPAYAKMLEALHDPALLAVYENGRIPISDQNGNESRTAIVTALDEMPGTGKMYLIVFALSGADRLFIRQWSEIAQKLAHEIKSPLSTVLLSAQQLTDTRDERNDKYLHHIRTQAVTVKQYINRFLQFANLSHPHIEVLELKNIIADSMKEFSLGLPKRIRCHSQFPGEPVFIKGDAVQLKLLFGSLLKNSLDAVKLAGSISVSMQIATDFNVNKKNKVHIELSDTGCGIDSSDMDRIFEPFFTRKPDGCGIGLVIAKQIVEQHQGRISIVSEKDVGTTVFIEFPVCQETK